MKTLMGWAVRLYPAAWRERYGAEFEALLEDVGPSGGDLWNVVRGAMAMQMTTLNFGKLLAACAVAGAVLAGAWSLTLPDRYVSTAVIGIDGGEAGIRRLEQLQLKVLGRQSLSTIIQRDGLYKSERAKLPLEDVIAQMRNRDVRMQLLQRGPDTRAVSIQFKADTPAAAQATVKQLVAAFADQNAQVSEGAVRLEVLDAASLPVVPVEPRRSRVIVMGLLAGLLLGLVAGGAYSAVARNAVWSLKRVGSFTVTGMALGLAVAMMIPDEFISTAVLRAASGADVSRAIQRVLSAESLEAIVKKEGLYRGTSPAEAAGKMRNQAVRVQTVGNGGGAFTVSFMYGDRETAQRVTLELVKAFTAAIPVVEVLDPPSQPALPSYPNRLAMGITGLFAGVVLGLVSTRFRKPVAATA